MIMPFQTLRMNLHRPRCTPYIVAESFFFFGGFTSRHPPYGKAIVNGARVHLYIAMWLLVLVLKRQHAHTLLLARTLIEYALSDHGDCVPGAILQDLQRLEMRVHRCMRCA